MHQYCLLSLALECEVRGTLVYLLIVRYSSPGFCINTEIKVNGQRVETVTNVKYLGFSYRISSLRYSPG